MVPTAADVDRLIDRLRSEITATAGGRVALTSDEAKLLLDELSRMRQSNDRLRKQNKKVRKKVARISEQLGVPPDDEAETVP